METNQKLGKTKMLPLSNDYVFKRIFGKGGNERILKSLLEAIIRIKIESIEVQNPEIPKENINDKLSILDIKAVINENTIIDIEMQVGNVDAIERRLVVYGSKLIASDIKVAEDYINTKDTIVICIVNDNITKRNSYLSVAKLRYDEQEEIRKVDMGYKIEDKYLTEMIKYYIIELGKFKRKKPKIADLLEKWLSVIGGDEEMMDEYKKENGEIKEAIEQLEVMSADKEEREKYEAREKAIISHKMELYASIERGRREGEAIGRKEGEAIGRKQGEKKGRQESKKEIANKLMKENISIEVIQKVTGLTKEELENIYNEN